MRRSTNCWRTRWRACASSWRGTARAGRSRGAAIAQNYEQRTGNGRAQGWHRDPRLSPLCATPAKREGCDVAALSLRVPGVSALVSVVDGLGLGAAGPAGLGHVALPEPVFGGVRELLLDATALADAAARLAVRHRNHPVVNARRRSLRGFGFRCRTALRHDPFLLPLHLP